MVRAVEGFDGRDVVLADGARIQPEVAIAATGRRPNLEPLVGHLGVLARDGRPRFHAGHSPPGAPGLYFLGYRIPPPQLADFRHDARSIARTVERATRAQAAHRSALAPSSAAASR